MIQENKDLLLQDLCARLPYGVKCIVTKSRTEEGQKGDVGKITCMCLEGVDCISDKPFFSGFGNFKPYLFPLSSMTEEQKKELDKKFHLMGIYGNNILIHYHSQGYWDTDLEVDFQDWLWLINWLNKNHFDYRGLIEKSLALDATGLNIY
jgi:hypothetical protein